MTRRVILPLFVLFAALLAACASTGPTASPAPILMTPSAPQSSNPATPPTAVQAPASSGEDLSRADAQGSVEFVVTPLNLGSPGETLDFDVSMNTHSVDLSWDLAAQSVLSADTGLEVSGLSWPVGSGHHYEGTLTFPAKTADGQALLEGAQTVTLTIRNTDVAERVFVWKLSR